ncbi:envoplakin a [Pristis pectinata]|uniref:envoplakin a n=1 Tax=Pristis pectinata TaxID=685728 RepID=UPI00223E58CB|nr:envoplakin a [Pristis pectinata]
MFSKKGTFKVSPSSKLSSDLPVLIARMQKNGDQVETDILDTEEKLRADKLNYENNRPFKYEAVNNENLARSEGLLKDLFLDADKAKKLRHPQGQEIETDVKRMHERWVQQCSTYRDLYEKLKLPKTDKSVDWPDILAQKQLEISKGGFGSQLPELERQVASHHILSKEIEAYGPQINSQSIPNPEELRNVQKQYKNLVDSSKLRGHQLDDLYSYMQDCTKQLMFMNEQQEKIQRQDWSDRMLEPEEVRKQYESFKENGLLAEEEAVNRIQDNGERLMKLKHPGSPAIEAHKDAVKNEWQQFLNLCICQEAHLKNVEDYRKFQYDADNLSQSIKKHSAELDNKFSKYNDNPRVMSDLLHQFEGDEKNIIQMDKEMNDLRRRSQQIAPLKARRTPVSKPFPVTALCDWDDRQNEVSRGEKLMLQDNDDLENWVVVNSSKQTKRVPGVCFNIPPPDSEVIGRANRLAKDLDDLKRKRSDTENKLKNHYNELRQMKPTLQDYPTMQTNLLTQSAAPGEDDPQSKDLLSKLNKINDNLGETEKEVMSQLHMPINRSAPTQDIADRLKDQQNINSRLQKIGVEKDSVKKECESHLLKKPTGPSASLLPKKLNDVTNKHKNVTSLANLYQNKASSQLELENSIKKANDAIKIIESNLAEESAVPATSNAMQQRKTELQRLRRELNNDQDKLQKANQDLRKTEDSCKPLELNFQEYCPDIKKQRAEVQKLNNRFQNASDQLDLREEMLQNADGAQQRYKTSLQGLNSWMDNLPNNQVQPTASLNEVQTKLQAQKKLVNDIKKKEPEKDELVRLSQDLQSTLKDYETNNDKYRASLDSTSGPSGVKKLRSQTLQDSIKDQEKDTVKRFAEVSSSNDQLLSQLDFVTKVKQKQQESPIDEVVMQQNVKSSFASRGSDIQQQYKDEEKKTKLAQAALQEQSKRLSLLRARRPVDQMEEKEVVKYYRDPKVEANLSNLRNEVHQVRKQRQETQSDINATKQKISLLEGDQKNAKIGLLTKEVKKIERLPALDAEAENLRSEISTLRREKQITIGDWDRLTREVTILEQKPVNVKERVVVVEKVKVEKDPGMLKASKELQDEIEDEVHKKQVLTEKIRTIRTQIETLEKQSGKTDPKIMIKEIKKIERDPELEKELVKLRDICQDDSHKNSVLEKELSELQRKYRIIDEQKPKIETKEIVQENFRVLPETEQEIAKLKKEIRETAKRRGDVEMEITIAHGDLEVLKDRKPQIQYKDITKEIVKLQKSPEMLKEIDQLKHKLPQMEDDHGDMQVKIKRLKNERDEWRKERSKIETKVVTKDVVKYEDDPMLDKEVARIRTILREESEKRRHIESIVFDLQNMYSQLQRQKPEEKVVVQEMVRLEKDPKLAREHDNLGRTLDEERNQRRNLEREVQHLKDLVEEKERELNLEEEKGIHQAVKNEMEGIKYKIRELESTPPPLEEKIVTEEVLKVEKDPVLERLAGSLRQQLEQERNKANSLDKEIKKIQLQLEILHREKSQEKLICREVIRIEKDKALEEERAHTRDLYNKEKNSRLDIEEELRRVRDRCEKLEDSIASRSQVESDLRKARDNAFREKADLEDELKNLETEREQKTFVHKEESKRLSQHHVKEKQRKQELDDKLSWIETEIMKERDKIHEKEYRIRDLESQISREEARQRDIQMRETNLSTKISIVDPSTGKDLSPYEAYKRNLIDREQYMNLQKLECDWEEIFTHGISGESSVLRDKKSGKEYSIEAALKDGRITKEDLKLYREGKLPISEFALLVAGEDKPMALHTDLVNSTPPISPAYQSTNYSSPSFATYRAHTDRDQQAIAGVYDNTTNSKMSITNALNKKLLEPITAQRLLEAQAATGGIIDIATRERHSVHKALDRNLIDKTHERRLLNAQKAFTGLEDPVTKERLSVGVALQKGWLPTDIAHQYLEAQYLTGGLVDPNHSGRVSTKDALRSNMIDSNTARVLQEESNYAKDLVDPMSGERVSYKELMKRCKKDELSGLLLLPVKSDPHALSSYQSSSRFDPGYYSPYSSLY